MTKHTLNMNFSRSCPSWYDCWGSGPGGRCGGPSSGIRSHPLPIGSQLLQEGTGEFWVTEVVLWLGLHCDGAKVCDDKSMLRYLTYIFTI